MLIADAMVSMISFDCVEDMKKSEINVEFAKGDVDMS